MSSVVPFEQLMVNLVFMQMVQAEWNFQNQSLGPLDAAAIVTSIFAQVWDAPGQMTPSGYNVVIPAF